MELMRRIIHRALVAVSALTLVAQELPEGPGRAEMEKMCKQCHEIARSISPRQDRDGWATTMRKMTAFGMKGSDADFVLVLDYLAKHYPAEAVPRVNVNQASAIELESGLSLRRSQAKALIAYRAEKGPFKTIDDLKKVPSLDAAMIEEKKDKIRFE